MSGECLQRSAVHQADMKSEKTKKNSGDGLWMLDKDPIFFEEMQENVVHFHAAWFSASHTFQSLEPNREKQWGKTA